MDETPSKTSPDYVTRRQLCTMLDVSRQTLYDWGLEPDVVIGGMGLWWRPTVDKIAEEHGRQIDA